MKHKHPSTTPGCTQTATPYQSATSGNVVAPSEEISAFLEQVKSTHPKLVILSLVERQPHPHPLPKRVRRLPSPLTPLFNQKNKNLDRVQLDDACQSAFEALSITAEEADYIEHSTRLQARSSLWFEHRAGRLTASKFAQISHTRVESPSLSLLKSVMQYTRPQTHKVPALKWGVDHEDMA